MAEAELSRYGGRAEEIGGRQTEGNSSAESWLIRVKEGCNPQHNIRQVSPKVCIYRVPKFFMDSNPQAYVPMIVSLGPYHHKVSPNLSAMDEHKFEAVHRTLARLKDVTLDNLIAEIKHSDNDIRDCYEDSATQWNEEMLAWMIVMDACFILEYLRASVQKRIFDMSSYSLVFQDNSCYNQMQFAIMDDIMKLENQIPLFILVKILQLEFGTREHAVSRLAGMLTGFKDFGGYPFCLALSDEKVESRVAEYIEKGACHLLDLCRRPITNMLTQSSRESVSSTVRCVDRDISSRSSFCPRTELLKMAGIKFRSGQFEFQKRRFGDSTLSLPRMNVDDNTETRLRNLMAYEECQRCSCSPEKTIISHYILLMDALIDSERDVSILKKAQIIESGMGSDEEIADIFNHLGKGITTNSGDIFEFDLVAEEAREHYNSQWKVWIYQFKEEHCSKPWYVVSLVAAIIILIMTAVQTFYSVKNK